MGEIQTFFSVFLAIAVSVTTIGGAIGVIEHFAAKAKKPHQDLEDEVEKQGKHLEKHDQLLDNDNRRLKDVEATNRLIVRGIMTLLSHEIDGNHTKQLEQARDEMYDYLSTK